MLSAFRRNKFTALFRLLDLNHDGHIDLADFTRYAEGLRAERGWAADDPRVAGLVDGSSQWWREMVRRAGGSDKIVTLDEFLTFWSHVGTELSKGAVPPWALNICTRIHQALDSNDSGTVDAKDYAVWLRAVRSDADAHAVFATLDLNHDGVVSLGEMMVLFAQFALSEDPAEPGNLLMTGKLA